MDVVRSNVERIGGIVEVDSTVGQGTRMTLRVPLTLTIIPALTVSIGSQHFAIPRSAIDEIVRANGESVTLERLGGAGVATIRGRRVPEVALADILGLHSELKDEERTLIVLRPAGGDVYALAVDRIHDHEELVVKPAAPAVMASGLYAGTTLADDGSPILLFDAAGLAQVGGIKLEAQDRAARVAEGPTAAAAAQDIPVLLFRGLDGARRALRLAIVDRIEEVPASAIRPGAGQLRVQLGEAILPIAGVHGAELPTDKVRLFRLNDGRQEIGYVFQEVIDLAAIEHDVIRAERAGEISGVTLIGGEPAELIDAHWLFANHVGAAAGSTGAQPVCRMPSSDPWMQNMLRPIIEAAGYRVVGEGDDAEADVVILSDAGPVELGPAARTIRLRSDPEGEEDGSVYRYDRAGLLMALKSAGRA
jgi:two-component system chemotaxis sensor kinase CheA